MPVEPEEEGAGPHVQLHRSAQDICRGPHSPQAASDQALECPGSLQQPSVRLCRFSDCSPELCAEGQVTLAGASPHQHPQGGRKLAASWAAIHSSPSAEAVPPSE